MRHRYIEDAPQGHNKKQIWIALNINELDLLAGIAAKLASNLPSTGPTKRLQMVAKEMSKEMHKSIRELEKAGVDERSKEKYPYDDRAVI